MFISDFEWIRWDRGNYRGKEFCEVVKHKNQRVGIIVSSVQKSKLILFVQDETKPEGEWKPIRILVGNSTEDILKLANESYEKILADYTLVPFTQNYGYRKLQKYVEKFTSLPLPV